MRAFAQSIVETVRHPLVVLDGEFRLVQANPAFYRLFGDIEAEPSGRSLFDLSSRPWDEPGLRALLESVLPGNSFRDFEVTLHLPEGGTRVLLLDARRVLHDDGTPMILLTAEDVTARVQAEDELRRLNLKLESRVARRTTELEAANRELEAFCYSVSHDLRAPLRAIDGFSDELLRNHADRLDEKGQHYLQRVRAATQKMGRLIDDMLRLSRLSRGEMRPERVDLTAMAEAVVAELRQQAPERQVSFTVEPGLTVVGDPGLLKVALENLIGNAWKFTSKGPSATITIGRCERDGVPTFFVRDDGVGFDMAHAGKLFGAFQRLHAERDFPGIGIGLATVQRVVRRHGGRVWAEGFPGEGATFYFTLPEGSSP